jgi:hypothetical protein
MTSGREVMSTSGCRKLAEGGSRRAPARLYHGRQPRLPFDSIRGCFVTFAAMLLLAGCGGDRSREPLVPVAEFLVAAGDSTFWVASDSTGVRFRGAPMTLAHWGNRFYEIYAADDDRSYYDAVFVGQRIFRRDLLTGDSLPVFEDTLVSREADEYAAAHPAERALGPEDEGAEDPRSSATSEAVLLDVFGPYLAYEYRADVEVFGGRDLHATHRGMLDLRTGRRATLAALFGRRAADSLASAGRRELVAALESIRARDDRRLRRAETALDGLAFDATSFSLVAVGARPAVTFLVPGHGPSAGLSLALPPIPAPVPAWWKEAARPRPTVSDSLNDRWTRPDAEVAARYDTTELAALVLRGGSREWTVGRVPSPVRQLWWLHAPPLDRATRRALSRAFDESALYSEETRLASAPRRAQPTIVRAVRAEGPARGSAARVGRAARAGGARRTR